MATKQEDFWQGEFGRSYTDRNTRDPGAWDDFYRTTWGATKIQMNERILGPLERSSRILEVGCNTGMQLAGLGLGRSDEADAGVIEGVDQIDEAAGGGAVFWPQTRTPVQDQGVKAVRDREVIE